MSEKETACFESLTDEDLVKLSQDGNNLALDTLARRFLSHKPKMYSAGYLDVDDLLQEGMISFLSAVRTYSGEKGVPFSAYATVCINNGIISAARKTKNDFQIDREIDPVDVNVEAKNPLDAIVDSENLSSVLVLCENVLSDVEKSVVYSQMSGLSYTETAEKLGLTPKAVDNALQRARKKLKSVFN
ncbi:MAG: sigma-70 family RNA polymerase sigma factor [Clostridia bacterium]|nr:sigma-70 family RNA polymerase sigma factor [Clostridia bacterium]